MQTAEIAILFRLKRNRRRSECGNDDRCWKEEKLFVFLFLRSSGLSLRFFSSLRDAKNTRYTLKRFKLLSFRCRVDSSRSNRSSCFCRRRQTRRCLASRLAQRPEHRRERRWRRPSCERVGQGRHGRFAEAEPGRAREVGEEELVLFGGDGRSRWFDVGHEKGAFC